MNQSSTPQANPGIGPARQRGRGRILARSLVWLAAGMAAGAFLAWQLDLAHGPKAPAAQTPAGAITLSAPTSEVLRRLAEPLEIRFYCSLDSATVPPSTAAFAQRVERLLAQFESDAGGKLKLALHDSQPGTDLAKAAQADGIKPFNLEKGDACFLGIAVVGKQHKESLERLAPEWEPALEFDLARAIERTAQAEVKPLPVIVAPTGGPPPLEEVKRLIPNLEAVSLEEGTRLLREAALKEFTRAAQEMQTRIQQAQAKLLAAQTNQSDAQQQAAMKELQQFQADQTAELQRIAARSQAQIQTLARLKAAPR